MPALLDYASPQTNRQRRRPVGDTLVVILALLQFCGWTWSIFTDASRIPVIGTEQWSLFALAWRYTQNCGSVSIISSLASLFALFASTRPVEKRFGKYLGYMVLVSLMVGLHWIAMWYLHSQMPYAFATMIRAGDNTAPMLLLFHPVYFVCIVRLVRPSCGLEGR